MSVRRGRGGGLGLRGRGGQCTMWMITLRYLIKGCIVPLWVYIAEFSSIYIVWVGDWLYLSHSDLKNPVGVGDWLYLSHSDLKNPVGVGDWLYLSHSDLTNPVGVGDWLYLSHSDLKNPVGVGDWLYLSHSDLKKTCMSRRLTVPITFRLEKTHLKQTEAQWGCTSARVWGCSSGGVFVPGIYTHARWESP